MSKKDRKMTKDAKDGINDGLILGRDFITKLMEQKINKTGFFNMTKEEVRSAYNGYILHVNNTILNKK